MQKALVQLAVMLLLFFGSWAVLSQVNFVKLFRVEQAAKSTEEKLGELIMETIRKTEDKIEDQKASRYLNRIKKRICQKNNINSGNIKLHFVHNSEVNAFALPNGHLVVYSGLLTACENPEELAGILGHEIAHIQQKHIMNKLVKEVGLSVLISTAAGNGGGMMVKELLHHLSSSAYDRTLESEADQYSVEYLLKAGIDPEPFANFMFRLSENREKDIPEQFFWLSTHPGSEDRAKTIIALIDNREATGKPVLTEEEWQHLKEVAGE